MSNDNTTSGHTDPVISVDRCTKKIACFNGFHCVRDFQTYADEAVGIQEAHEWFKGKTIHVPQVVFPVIRKLRMSS